MRTRKDHKPKLTKNELRARRARKLAKMYAGSENFDECTYQDIITDILHACRLEKIDIETTLDLARSNFDCEICPDDIEETVTVTDIASLNF